VNHYLTDRFAEEMVLPEGLLGDFMRTLSLGADARVASEAEYVAGIRKKLLAARDRWVEESGSETIFEQQQRRVHSAVNANWVVEKKTFTDLIHKETMTLLAGRRLWIQNELHVDKAVLEGALEDAETVQKRKRAMWRSGRSCEVAVGGQMPQTRSCQLGGFRDAAAAECATRVRAFAACRRPDGARNAKMSGIKRGWQGHWGQCWSERPCGPSPTTRASAVQGC